MEFLRVRNGHVCQNEDSIWNLLRKIRSSCKSVMRKAVSAGPRNYSERSKEPLNIFE